MPASQLVVSGYLPALHGTVGALFAVPVVAIVSATLRYLSEALVFERRRDFLLAPTPAVEGPRPENAGRNRGGKEASEEAET